jgi:hypothetical protein
VGLLIIKINFNCSGCRIALKDSGCILLRGSDALTENSEREEEFEKWARVAQR